MGLDTMDTMDTMATKDTMDTMDGISECGPETRDKKTGTGARRGAAQMQRDKKVIC